MSAQDYNPPRVAIHAKLAKIAASCTPFPSWYAAWSRLGPQSTEEERLAVYQAVRNSGSLPEDAGFYLVAWQIDFMAEDDAEEALRDLEDRLESIRQAHGLAEDDFWCAGEGPPEYEETMRQCHAAWGDVLVAKLEACGEKEMAQLFRADRTRFDELREVGRQFFHGPAFADDSKDPAWLDNLLQAVSACVEPDSPMGPLGLRYTEEEGFWEVEIYPTPVEVVGGAHDGELVAPGFSLNIEELRSTFDSITDLGWNALALTYPEGPHVYVEGMFQGHEVYVEVLAYAPDDEEPGMKFDANNRPAPPG